MSKQKLYAKGLTALAVAAAMSAAHAEVDGWSYGNQGARAAALQLGYLGLEDSFNVWVNPALARQYGDRAVVHFTEEDADGQRIQAGGVFYNWGVHTFGAYIGRPSASPDELAYADQHAISTQPNNQFDLFWAGDFGAAVVGARLNYQAVEDSESEPFERRTDSPLTTNPTFGATNTRIDRGESVSTDASELNLSVGFQLAALPIDGAITIGMPSRSFTDRERVRTAQEQYEAGVYQHDNSINERTEVISRELDGAGTLGLALRARLRETERSHLMIGGFYQQVDYSWKGSRAEDSRNRTNRDATTGAYQNEVQETFRASTNVTDEMSAFGLNVAQHFSPQAGTRVVASLGLILGDFDESTRSSIDQAERAQRTTAGTTTTYFAPYGAMMQESVSGDFLEIPFVVALEHALNERWTVRASAAKNLYSSWEWTERTVEFDSVAATTAGEPATWVRDRTESEKTELLWTETDTTVSLGLGYTVGRFDVDAVITQRFVTDSVGNNGPFGNVTLGYRF